MITKNRCCRTFTENGVGLNTKKEIAKGENIGGEVGEDRLITAPEQHFKRNIVTCENDRWSRRL